MAKRPSLGKRKHSIEIQVESETPDSGGGRTLAWVKLGTVQAAIIPVSVNEQIRGMQMDSPVSHKITTRYRSDITPKTKHRIVYGSRIFNVRSIINVEEKSKDWLFIVDEGKATQ